MMVTAAELKAHELSGRIERLPVTSWQVKVLIFVGVATFFDAYDNFTIAFALPAIVGVWHIRPQQVGFLISVGNIGQLFGAIFFGWLADRVGRLRALIITILIFAVLSVFCASSWSYTSLLAFRLLQGFGLGGEVPIAACYINEIINARIRGKFFLLCQLSFPVGMTVTSIVGYWLVTHLGWRWLFFLGGVPALLTILLRWGLPESPRWLAGMGRVEEAEKTMTRIEKSVRKAFGADLPEPEAVSLPTVQEKRATVADLFRGIYLRRTVVLWSIFLSTYLANSSIAAWLPTIYKTIYKVPTDKALLYSIVIFVVGLPATIACALLIDKVGRRVWIAGSLIPAGGLFIVLWWLGATTVAQVLVMTTAAFIFTTTVSLALILYAPELYPTRMRGMGTAMGTVWYRMATITGPLIIGIVIAHYTFSWVFLFFGTIALLGGLVAAFFGVETKGRVLEEISP